MVAAKAKIMKIKMGYAKQRCNEAVHLPCEMWPSLCFLDVPHNFCTFYVLV